MGRFKQESNWVQRNREVKDGTWRKTEGHHLTPADIGKKVMFEHLIEWEDGSQHVEGILTRIGKPETYYFPVDIIPEGGNLFGMYFGNVYGQELYIKKE